MSKSCCKCSKPFDTPGIQCKECREGKKKVGYLPEPSEALIGAPLSLAGLLLSTRRRKSNA